MSVMGTMSAKFVLKAGLLLLAVRIDMHSTSAVLDPSEAISVFDRRDAARIGVDIASKGSQTVARNRVVGIDRVEFRLRTARIGVVPPGTGFVLGADLLKQMPLMLDFMRNRLAVLDDRQLMKFETGLSPVAARIEGDGCLTMMATSADGAGVKVALVAGPSASSDSAQPIRLGDVSLTGQRNAPSGPCRDSDVTIGWGALARHRVLFDLAHDRLWIS